MLFGGGASEARALLGTIAGGLITTVSLVFSLTVVVFQLASSQYSPRLLRVFPRDGLVRVTLGVLVGAFAYSLTVMRTVRGDQVPRLSVTVAFLATLAGALLLVAFLGHIVRELRVETMLKRVHAEQDRAIGALLTDLDRADPPAEPAYAGPTRAGRGRPVGCAGSRRRERPAEAGHRPGHPRHAATAGRHGDDRRYPRRALAPAGRARDLDGRRAARRRLRRRPRPGPRRPDRRLRAHRRPGRQLRPAAAGRCLRQGPVPGHQRPDHRPLGDRAHRLGAGRPHRQGSGPRRLADADGRERVRIPVPASPRCSSPHSARPAPSAPATSRSRCGWPRCCATSPGSPGPTSTGRPCASSWPAP